jgi:hypothetical protein
VSHGIRRAVLVVLSDDISVPLTFGFRRQTIVLPAAAKSWSDDDVRRALRHELEHVRRDDWAHQLFARAICAIYWPHPLAWAAWKRFYVEAERACDDAVVGAFEPSSYASQLVSLARTVSGRNRVPALAMAAPSRLSERVKAILDPAQSRGPHSRPAGAMIMAATVAVLLSLGSVQLVAAAKDDDPEFEADLYREAAIKAAQRGSISSLERLIALGFNINTAFDGDGTVLLIAAKHGRVEAVRFLLDRGADVNGASPGDGNPLIAASEHGELDAVKLLLDRGARIEEVVEGDENALIQASGSGHAEVVKLLISRGANVNARVWTDDKEWRYPLQSARRGGHHHVVKILRAAGAVD